MGTEKPSQKAFSLLIKPAGADCNLRCDYCFYSRTRSYPRPIASSECVARMPDTVLEKLIRDFLSYRLPQSVLCWQGGEPTLMGLDFFTRVVQLEQQHGAPGQVVANSIQTNGVLINDEWAEFLAQYRFLIGISLDGPPEIHDHYRLDHAGHASHARVLEGIAALQRHHTEYNVLTMITSLSVHQPELLYSYFRDRGLQFMQLIPCIELKDIEHPEQGLAEYAIQQPEQYGEFLCKLFDKWYAEEGLFNGISIRTFDSMIMYHLTGEMNMCTYSPRCNHYLMVEANGDIYPCDFFMQPQLVLDNVMRASLQSVMQSAGYAKFGAQKSASLPDECIACRWLKQCFGGCIKDRINPDGSPSKRSFLCAGDHMFFEHTHDRMLELAARVRFERVRHSTDWSRIARNDPCPCASGKKFKHCCAKRM